MGVRFELDAEIPIGQFLSAVEQIEQIAQDAEIELTDDDDPDQDQTVNDHPH